MFFFCKGEIIRIYRHQLQGQRKFQIGYDIYIYICYIWVIEMTCNNVIWMIECTVDDMAKQIQMRFVNGAPLLIIEISCQRPSTNNIKQLPITQMILGVSISETLKWIQTTAIITFFLEKICPASGIEHGYDALTRQGVGGATLQSLWPSSVQKHCSVSEIGEPLNNQLKSIAVQKSLLGGV